jgi:hypothetical protein
MRFRMEVAEQIPDLPKIETVWLALEGIGSWGLARL